MSGKSEVKTRDSAIPSPHNTRLSEIADDIGLDLNDEEIQEYRDAISTAISETFQDVYDMVEPKLPVMYPRTPGYRPTKEENPLNAWYWRCDIQGPRGGILEGKTIAIKDNIAVAGVPMIIGSRVLEGFVPDIDATVVTRVLDAGGQILGKATCEEFCFSDSSLSASTGPVLNPLQSSVPTNQPMMAGGSSSGCAALIAAGEVVMAIGGDQGGSIRTPAAACGIVGLKPTFGLVPYTGIASLDFTVDHTGPMAKDVWNTALLLEAIAGRDGDRDQRQPCNLTVPPYTKLLTGDIKGIRIGLVKEGFDSPSMDSLVRDSVKSAADLLRKEAGASVEEVSIPWHGPGAKLSCAMFLENAGTALLDGRTFSTSSYNDIHLQQAIARGLKAQPNHLSRIAKFSLILSRYMKETCNGVIYSKAQNLRSELTRAYDNALKTFDVLIMPTCPDLFKAFPDKDASLKEYMDSALISHPNTAQFDVSGHPAITINVPPTDKQMSFPIGMMIVGKKFDEVTVLNVAYAYEKLRENMDKTYIISVIQFSVVTLRHSSQQPCSWTFNKIFFISFSSLGPCTSIGIRSLSYESLGNGCNPRIQ